MEIPIKSPFEFICNDCNFKCCNKKDYKRHLTTAKHLTRINRIQNTHNTPDGFYCECGKQYKYKRGLWNHKQKCKVVEPEQAPVTPPLDSSLVIELLKQNQEFKELMIEQHKRMTEQQDTIIELSKNTGNTTNNNTINNTTNNNKFNLNVFLNETCKDAINLNDFIQSI